MPACAGRSSSPPPCWPPASTRRTSAGWAERAASRNRLDEKLAALSAARTAPGDKAAAVKPLCEVLKQAPRARAEAAVILGEIGDPPR